MWREELEKLKGQIDCMDTPEAKQLSSDMQKILNSPQDYYGKVSSSLRVAPMELTSGNIGKVVGKADTLGKVVVSMIQSFVGRVFSSGRKVNPPLCLYIDE